MTQMVRYSTYNCDLQADFGTYHGLLLAATALLGSYLATWQVGCTESSYFYSTRVVGSIIWTLLE